MVSKGNIFQIPLSGIKIVGRKDLLKINTVIDEIPYIDELQKTFYKTMLKERKEKIIDFSLNKLLVREQI